MRLTTAHITTTLPPLPPPPIDAQHQINTNRNQKPLIKNILCIVFQKMCSLALPFCISCFITIPCCTQTHTHTLGHTLFDFGLHAKRGRTRARVQRAFVRAFWAVQPGMNARGLLIWHCQACTRSQTFMDLRTRKNVRACALWPSEHLSLSAA